MSKKSANGDGNNYMLSAMLGYSSGRGNSVEEIVNGLKRSAGADGTRPTGTVYLMKNENIRSTTRSLLFNEVKAALKSQRAAVKIEQGKVPQGKRDVIGTTLGTAKYNWKRSESQFLPGAICDNLTSFGGVLRDGASQTPLSEAIRYGAAGATGTVLSLIHI